MLPNEPFCFTDLQYLTVPLPAEIAALRENADFAGEVRRIDKLLPRVTDTIMRKRLQLEQFIAAGLTKDYRIGFDEMLSLLQKHHPYMTAAHLYAILDMGFADEILTRPAEIPVENNVADPMLFSRASVTNSLMDKLFAKCRIKKPETPERSVDSLMERLDLIKQHI